MKRAVVSQSQDSFRPAKRRRLSFKSKSRRPKGEARLIPGLSRRGGGVFGFPNTIITKLRYCTFLDLSGTAGTVISNVFAANGCFDPDITGVGHQPLFYDNFTAVYDQYSVLGSKIKVTYQSSSTTLGHIIGITGDDDATTSSNLETLMEQSNSVSAMVGAAGSPPVTLSNVFDPVTCFGVAVKDDGYSATAINANPTELWTYKVWAIPADAATLSHCYVKIEIDYTVKFTELKTPVQN